MGAAEESLGSISAQPPRGPGTLNDHFPSVPQFLHLQRPVHSWEVQSGQEKALTKLIFKKKHRQMPGVHSSQVARCAITRGEGAQDPFQPRTLQGEAGQSFVITEFSLDGLLTPSDPLLPQLSTRIITQPAKGCWELA